MQLKNASISRCCAIVSLLTLMLFAISAVLSGCGASAGSHPPAVDVTQGANLASARVVVHWPQAVAGRSIPGGANRLILFVSGEGLDHTAAYILDRQPNAGDTQSVNLEFSAGLKRLFAVEARKVDSTVVPYPDIRLVPTDSADLLAGTRLGAGNDPQPHDVGVGDSINVSLSVAEATQPGSQITSVNLTINQVLTTDFPSILVLQLIRDQNGNPITDVNAGNFDVIEDGRAAVVTDVRTVDQADQNLSVALVLDRSGSMYGEPNTNLEGAASQFISLLTSNDAAEVINFSDVLNIDAAFTSDKASLLAAINGYYANGGTALYDALGQAIRDTAARGGRAAVIGMTDGENNSGAISSSAEIVTLAHSKGIPIFLIGLGSANQNTLESLATDTGGIYSFAPNSSQLADVYQRISNQLNKQVRISFISPDPHRSGRNRNLIIRFHYGSFLQEARYTYIF